MSLTTFQAPVRSTLDSLESTFTETLSSHTQLQALVTVLEHATQTPGKWVRSSLCMYAANIIALEQNTQVDESKLICLSKGIEAIHLASLVHDDIFDAAQTRRNIRCVYKEFNLNTGILSGIYIYSIALQLISHLNNSSIVSNLSYAVSCLCEGEFQQLHERHNWDLALSDYWKIIENKTAALFESACYCGAKLLNASEDQCKKLALFGKNFGILFQLLDDYKDFFDTESTLKKNPFQDLVMGDVSYPLMLIKQHLSPIEWEKLLKFAKQNTLKACQDSLSPSLNNTIKEQLKNLMLEKTTLMQQQLATFKGSVYKDQLLKLIKTSLSFS